MSINEIMQMPLQFLLDIAEEKNESKKEKSLIAAFGGGSPLKENT